MTRKEVTEQDIKNMDRLDEIRVAVSHCAAQLERINNTVAELKELRTELEDGIDTNINNLNGLEKGLGTDQFVQQRDHYREQIQKDTIALIDTITAIHQQNVDHEAISTEWKTLTKEKAQLLNELGIL